jgi:hypothetical protein
MPLYYVTGVSGSGKSTVLKEMQVRGLDAHGVDEDGYANWVNRNTGEVTPYPGDDNFNIHTWYVDHEWVLDAEKVADLREQSDVEDKSVFLCGGASNEDKAWYSFNAVFALTVDVETIKRRVANRTDNHFGKAPDELDIILTLHKTSVDTYRQLGAVLIDASQPVGNIVNEIITKTTKE